MTRKGRRLALIAVALGVVAAAVGLALYALSDNIVFFYSPSEILQKNVQAGARLRVGGLVEPGSVVKAAGDELDFSVTDGANADQSLLCGPAARPVSRRPGRRRRGRAGGAGAFHAETILAKHDERYMPREVVEALKKQGRWQEGSAKP